MMGGFCRQVSAPLAGAGDEDRLEFQQNGMADPFRYT
jgi:hypothetical protein